MSSARQAAASLVVAGSSSPIAPAISKQPVAVTSNSGFGNAGGTIRMRSALFFPQRADAVTKNIVASAARNAAGQGHTIAAPANPAIQKSRKDATRM